MAQRHVLARSAPLPFAGWARRVVALAVLAVPMTAVAAPWARTGDVALRHDLQALADAGVIDGVLATWPVPWQAVAGALDDDALPADRPALRASARRVRAAARRALIDDGNAVEVGVAGADEPTLLRGYADTPRSEAEATAALENRSGRFAGRLALTRSSDDVSDDERTRLDGSFATWQVGNWWAGAGAIERWWGPGWDGSLILSNNARPVPGLMLERASAQAFATPWLSWIGPWRFSTFVGRLESERHVPDANVLGMRVAFQPLEGVTIGLSRAAQFGGDGRTVRLETMRKLLLGDDNQGGTANQPGNQLAGYEVRWSLAPLGVDAAVYTQLIGEDEANYLPRGHMAQFGAATWGGTGAGGSWRLFLEYADTTAAFDAHPPQFNAAYNHHIYETGYRYYGRSIGHTADGDSRIGSLGGVFVSAGDHALDWVVRGGRVNRDGAGPHGITADALEVVSLRVGYTPPWDWAEVRLRAGADRLEGGGATSEEGFASVSVGYRF